MSTSDKSSSQVYEFLAKPRPCVFLNAHGVEWRDDPNFVHWHLGDVVDDPADLISAIASAKDRHPLYIERQRKAAIDTFGTAEGSPSERGADAMLSYLSRA